MDVSDICEAIRAGELSTQDLVLINYALAARGANTTSILGQYGEELVAAAYGGKIERFDQKGYDVITDTGDKLQVKTYTKGRAPGSIRSFAFDVIAVEVDPTTAEVLLARRYSRDDLYSVFKDKWHTKYQHLNTTFAAWGGTPEDRFDRGWRIGATVPWTDETHRFRAAPPK